MEKQLTAKPQLHKYFLEIDMLKAFAALLVIMIHVSARYRGESMYHFLFWDMIHFAVGSFVFASGFLQGNSALDVYSVKDAVMWLWKKFKRIVVPYYFFAVFYLLVTILLTSWDKVAAKFSLEYFTDTIFLQGGVGNNWIPRLFVLISVVYLVVELLNRKFKYAHLTVFIISVLIAIYLCFDRTIPFSKVNNVPGWLVIYYAGYYAFHTYEKFKKRLPKYIALTGWLFLLFYLLMRSLDLKMGIFANKYPPSFYYDLYDIMMPMLTLYLILKVIPWVSKRTKLIKGINFVSLASYEVFFYHLIVLKVVSQFDLRFGILIDFVLVSLSTLGIIYIKRNYLKLKY